MTKTTTGTTGDSSRLLINVKSKQRASLDPLRPVAQHNSYFTYPISDVEMLRLRRMFLVDTHTSGAEIQSSTVATKIEQPTESFFNEIAESAPRRLVTLIQGGIENGDLGPVEIYWAAKSASRATPEIVTPILLTLLKQDVPIIREGAVYGLSKNKSPEIQRTLKHVAENDNSQGVRDAAGDFVELA